MKVIDNKKYFELAELKKMLKQKSWKDDWGVETIYVNGFIEFLEKIEIIEEDKPIEKLEKIPTSAYHFGKGITYCNFTNEQNINVLYLKNKINELIDVVNELKERR